MEQEEFTITDEDFKEIMDDHYTELNKIVAEENRINNRILKAILKVKGKEFYESLLLTIEEDECTNGSFEIVNKPLGQYQKEDFGEIKGLWVEQHSAGYEGDSFWGFVSVKLKENKWLQMPFAI